MRPAVLATPPPPITETLSYRYRQENAVPSDGNYLNEKSESVPFSSVFVVSLQQPSHFTGKNLLHLQTCLLHQGIVSFAPLMHRTKPFVFMSCFDTNLPLPDNAAHAILEFLHGVDLGVSVPYPQSWALEIPRQSWPALHDKIKHNLYELSHENAK